MTALFAALSLQHKIEQYGAYAGIGAIFGLGILSLLYFAQAREVKRLREWAGRAPERAAELEARVAADAQRRMTTPPVSPGAPVTPAAAQQAGAPVAPGAPATAAAAAAGAGVATTVKPATAAPSNGTGSGAAVPPPTKPGEGDGKPGEASVGQPGATPAGAPAATPAGQPGGATPQPVAREGQPPGATPPASPSGQPAATPAGAPASPAATPAGAPASPAATPAGAPGSPGATPPGATPPGQPGTPAPATPAGQPRPDIPAAAGAAAGRPAVPLRAPTPSAALPPRTPAGARTRTGDDGDRSRGRLAAIVGAGLAVVAALAVAGILIFGGGGGDKPNAKPNTVNPPSSTDAASSGSSAAKKAAAPKINRASITVSVLNGTTVTGLARQASDKVSAKGYRPGVVTNDTTDQQRPVTQIFYEPAGKAAALDVAKILAVKAVNVKPMDANARVAADRAQVAVFVGTDKAQ